MERLEDKDRELTEKIRSITLRISEHRKNGSIRTEWRPSDQKERDSYHSWRKISFHLHRRRSELKGEQGENRVHIERIREKLKILDDEMFSFTVFPDTRRKIEPATEIAWAPPVLGLSLLPHSSS